MLATPKSRGELFLASSLCDGLEDNDIKQVETLLSIKGADPNVLIPNQGVTPFHLVVGNESEKFAESVAKLFLRHGGDPNVRSSEGLTPVHIAAAWGRVAILEILLANGGDPLRRDDEGRTPFHYAFDGPYYLAVAMLGRYCDESCNEEEDERPKYKMTFDKIFVNKGNVVAEYISSENAEANKSRRARRAIKASIDDRTSSDGEINFNLAKSDNVTLRRYKKRKPRPKIPVVEEPRGEEISSVPVSSDAPSDESTQMKNQKISNRVEKNQTYAEMTAGRGKKDPPSTPRRLISADSSIISESPNCGISTMYAGTRRKKILSSTKNIGGRSERKNMEKTPPLKPSRPDGARIKSASSTPKKKEYASRLYGSAKLTSGHEKTGNKGAIDAARVAPKTNRGKGNEGREIPEYSPDVAKKPRKIARIKDAKNIVVRLEDIMYDDDRSQNSPADLDKTLRTREIHDAKNRSDKEEEMGISRDEGGRDRSRVSESPGSSNPLSVCSLMRRNDGTLNDSGADEAETKIMLEIEEAWRSRAGTPPASVSLLDVEDDDEKEKENFHSDYSSGETTCEFYEADPGGMSFWSRNQSFVSIDEEYTYEDEESGVAFIERHLRILSTSTNADMNRAKDETSWIDRLGELSIASSNASSRLSPSSSVIAKSAANYDDRLLRERLHELGDAPGPITKTTFNVYLKRLWRLERSRRKKNADVSVESAKIGEISTIDVPVDDKLPADLSTIDWPEKIGYYRSLDEEAFKEYKTADPRRKYRGGMSKTSFCYLLLDPRITRDLPRTGSDLIIGERWKTFLRAVFYVGKGKAARPVAHLYDAFGVWSTRQGRNDGMSAKVARIIDIWRSGLGVVCLHVFSHSFNEEACSREASIIDALGTDHLSNSIRGTYYGYATTFNNEEKRSLGKYLLYKSMEIFMHEGERQLYPRNVLL